MMQSGFRSILRRVPFAAIARQCARGFLVFMVTFWSFGGLDLYLGLTTPLRPATAGAAYTGKQLRTIEYIMADGSDNTTRNNGVLVYAGNTWNTTKGTAGRKTITIDGSGIRVVSAYLEVSFQITTAVNLTGLDVYFDADYSSLAGSDVPVAEVAGNTPFVSSGLTGYMRGTHNVTAFFATTTDAQWNGGVGVVAAASSTFSVAGNNRTLTTARLVITYEQDVSASAHNEVKTVRLPLDSSNGTDTGTRQAVCAAAATCVFTYDTRNLPDLTTDADILDAYVEVHAEVSSALAVSLRPQIVGGTTGPTYAGVETLTDDNAVNITYRPNIGAPNFTSNTLQTLNLVNGAGAAPLNVLGGEVVVTYRYSTGAAQQAETVRFVVDQDTATPGTATNTFRTLTPVISNSGRVTKHLWYRVHSSPYQAATFTVGGQVGTSTKKFNSYTISATNPRAGDTPTIIYDMSADAGNYFDNSTAIAGETRSTLTNGPVGVELFVTFIWNGDPASDVTKSVTFGAAQQGTNAIANSWNNRPVSIELPEGVTKTYRSAYLFTNYALSRATSILTGTVTMGVNASTTVVTQLGDTESYNVRYVIGIASSTLSGDGALINWKARVLEINETTSVANTAFFGNEVVITYDAALGENDPPTPPKKQLRTIEYVLGLSTDATARTTNTVTWAGATWATTKAGAGTRPIVIDGYNIRVVNAFLETDYYTTASGNTTVVNVYLDAEGSSSSGTDVPVGEAIGTTIHGTTGLTGHIRGNHDVTALFDRQSDAQWAAGVDVVGGFAATMAAGNRSLTSMKLYITYESDFTLVPHNEVKTVRFPLDSTIAGENGTRLSTCAAGALCPFTYTAAIPDAVTDADILDVHFEMHAEVNSNAAGDFDFQITTMPTPSNTFPWVENINDDNTVDVLYQPPIGGNGFLRNTTQTLNIGNGTVILRTLGGELVVTYRYNTGAPEQTETVRYFLNQGETTPGTTKTAFATITPTISNGEKVVKNIWYKVRSAPFGLTNLTINGRVGTSTERSQVYPFIALNRAGQTPTIIFDLSSDAGNYFNSTTTLAGASTFSAATGVAPVGAEAFVTFVWNGALGGTSTRTVLFSAAQQGVTGVANTWNNRPLKITLPETVTKTLRSAYLAVNLLHSNPGGGTITLGTITIGHQGITRSITENGDTEAFNTVYYNQIASSTFSGGDTIPWISRFLEINERNSMTNNGYYSNTAVVTYDAAQEYKIPTFTQNYFRFYGDNDALIPTDPWPAGAIDLGENTQILAADAPPGNGDNLRLRMSLAVATTTMLASSTAFSLQYAPRVSTCGAIGAWSTLGAPGSGSAWRGFNATPVDGANLSTSTPGAGQLLLSVSDRAGTYGESVPTPLNPFAVAVGEDVEYDWNIQNNGAATDTPYCFRMVKSDGSAFFSYDFYPTVRTAGYTAQSHYWRWYDDESNETPTTPLAAENVAPSSVANDNTIKLRITLNEVEGANGVNQKFKVQYSEWADFSNGVFDVIATSSCTVNSLWCYGDGVDTDDDPISTLLLTDSAQKGRHNEAATTSSTAYILASTGTEFEYTLKHAGARANTVYFFRLYDVNHDRPVALAVGGSYPSLLTEGPLMSATISGVASSTLTEGVTTDVDTTPTAIPFGTVPVSTGGVRAAQRLTISTNSTDGYQVYLKSDGDLISPYGHTIPGITSTNTAPIAWGSACLPGAAGCFGYHSGDNTLYGGSTRFLSDDTYAAVATTTYDEIVYNGGPIVSEVTDVVYRIEAHQSLVGGLYSTNIQYIVVPSF